MCDAEMWVNAFLGRIKKRDKARATVSCLTDAIITVIISIARYPEQIPRRIAHTRVDRSGQRRALSRSGNLGPRVHISRSACVNGFRDVGLLLRSCITRLYNANATDMEREVSYFADPGRPIEKACFNMQIKMQIMRPSSLTFPRPSSLRRSSL